MTMFDVIDKMLELLPKLTKEEADWIKSVIEWDDEKKQAFLIAKRMFEDKDDK